MGPRCWKRSLKNTFFPESLTFPVQRCRELPAPLFAPLSGLLVLLSVRGFILCLFVNLYHDRSSCSASSLRHFPSLASLLLCFSFVWRRGEMVAVGADLCQYPIYYLDDFNSLQDCKRQTDKDVKEYLHQLHRNKPLSQSL